MRISDWSSDVCSSDLRDVSVHPTTRLPGTAQIERDMAERMRRGQMFAVCYADLDHFKEFNDRYGYNEGDREIGRASCRERVCQYVYISGAAVPLKHKDYTHQLHINCRHITNQT